MVNVQLRIARDNINILSANDIETASALQIRARVFCSDK